MPVVGLRPEEFGEHRLIGMGGGVVNKEINEGEDDGFEVLVRHKIGGIGLIRLIWWIGKKKINESFERSFLIILEGLEVIG